MSEFIIILLVSIGLSVSEAQSTVLGGQVYDDKVLFFISKSSVFYHKVLYQYHSLTLVA
jgi:hypothetical protein